MTYGDITTIIILYVNTKLALIIHEKVFHYFKILLSTLTVYYKYNNSLPFELLTLDLETIKNVSQIDMSHLLRSRNKSETVGIISKKIPPPKVLVPCKICLYPVLGSH